MKVGFATETDEEVSGSGTELEASSSARTTAAARSAVAAEAKRIVNCLLWGIRGLELGDKEEEVECQGLGAGCPIGVYIKVSEGKRTRLSSSDAGGAGVVIGQTPPSSASAPKHMSMRREVEHQSSR